MPPLEGDEEDVEEGKGLKIVTPNNFLTRLPKLLAQIKAESNSYKLKMKSDVLYLQKVYRNLIKS